jgi:hypothetical protein
MFSYPTISSVLKELHAGRNVSFLLQCNTAVATLAFCYWQVVKKYRRKLFIFSYSSGKFLEKQERL